MLGTLKRLPVKNRRKVGMTSSPHGLYVQGYTRTTMGGTMSRKPARGSQSQKTALSSDCSLQLDCMRSEEHTSELQSLTNLVCRLLLEKKKNLRGPYCAEIGLRQQPDPVAHATRLSRGAPPSPDSHSELSLQAFDQRIANTAAHLIDSF